MKKRWIWIIVIVVAALLAFAALWIFLISPGRSSASVYEGEGEPDPVQIAEETECVDFDEDSGLMYINTAIVLVFSEDAGQDEIDEILKRAGADVDDTLGDIGIYRLVYDDPMSYDELTSLTASYTRDERIDEAYLDTVVYTDTDDVITDEEEDADTLDYPEAVYPNDSWEGADWNVDTPGGYNWGMEAIDAPGAWGYLDQMSTVKVGLIDTVPNVNHEDLTFSGFNCIFLDEATGKIICSTDPLTPTKDHGSHVAGTIAADWNNEVGVSGVMADKAQLYYAETYTINADKIKDSIFSTSFAYLVSLKTLIDEDVQVINISQNTGRLIGFAASRGNQKAVSALEEDAALVTTGLRRVIDRRQAAGEPDFVICISAGNSNATYYYPDESATYGYREAKNDLEKVGKFPGRTGEIGDSYAKYNNFLCLMDDEEIQSRLIVVGAVGIDGDSSDDTQTRYGYASFSCVGDRVDVVAPGVDIYSCYANGYGIMHGTSMAAPHVTGVCGLVFACNPNLSGPQVKEIVTGTTVGRYYYTGGCSGMVNAAQAVALATQTTALSPSEQVLETKSGSLDLCFVIDTTGSMEDDIDNAKDNMREILSALSEKTTDYRVAIIDYRDFSSRTGDERDYPYKLQLDFTDSSSQITDTINRLDIGYGGDKEETVYSALMAAVDLDWRSTASKAIIILGDAGPLDPEPNTGYTYTDVIQELFTADIGIDYDDSDERVLGSGDSSISVFTIDTGDDSDAADFFERIADGTGGVYTDVDSADEVSDAIMDSIEQIEVLSTVSATLDFGEELADSTINLYAGSDYLFSFRTDGHGCFYLEDMDADLYHWDSDSVYAGGSVILELSDADAVVSAHVTQKFSYAPAVTFMTDHSRGILVFLICLAAICVLVPCGFRVVTVCLRQRAAESGASPVQTHSLQPGAQAGRGKTNNFCPYCGARQSDNVRNFCWKCGKNLKGK